MLFGDLGMGLVFQEGILVMKTPRSSTAFAETLASGVLVEFLDQQGNLVGQAMYPQWNGQALPAIGDVVSSVAHCHADGRSRKLVGRVEQRHFDLQRSEQDETCIWVRLAVRLAAGPSRGGRRAVQFSLN